MTETLPERSGIEVFETLQSVLEGGQERDAAVA
jgi:hypothetical protein